MSELIAEARVLVTPDTAAFRPLLVKQLATATAGIVVPVQVTPVATGGANTALLAAEEARLASATARSAAEIQGATAAKNQAIKTNQAYARSLGGVSSGAASAGLSLVGLRGATLAATGPFLAGAAGAIALGNALQLATSFNSQIAVLGATTGATGVQLSQAAEAAREFGHDISLPGVTAGDAAQTITEFAKAGLSLNESIDATRGGLQLAQAAQISYADAVTLTAGALNAFNLSGGQAVRVADTLANAANLAQGGIEDTALALRQAAGAAAVVGVSFEDTTALLTLLARNGLTGSDAGTALRTAFLRLVNPSDEAKEVLAGLNVQLRDLNGNVRPEIFAEFSAAQRNLSAAQQQANAAIVFGQDAFRAFGFLGREGTRGLNQVRDGLDQTGTAARIAQARMTGLAGAQENLSNQLSALGLTIGEELVPPLTILVNQIAGFVAAGNQAISTATDLGAALKDMVPPAPPGFKTIFGPVGDVFGEVFKTGNPVGQALRVRDLLNRGNDEVVEEVKNGGVELRSAIEDAGRQAAQGAVTAGEQITRAFDAMFQFVEDTLRTGQQRVRAAAFQSVAGAGGQAAGLEEQFDQIVAGGGSLQQQLENLRKQAAKQQEIIDAAGPNAQGDLLKARRAAQKELARINQQITAIEEQMAADQKAAVQAQQTAKQKADQAFLDGLADQRQKLDTRQIRAQSTAFLADDIRLAKEEEKLLTQQIAQIRKSSLTEADKRKAIQALIQQRELTRQEIDRLIEQQATTREATQDALIQSQLALGESVLDLTGNKNLLLQAINRAIKEATEDRKAAKKGTKAWNDAQTEINRLLKRRKDVLEETEEEGKDAVGGTSLVDLFERAQDIVSGAGNVGFTTQGLQGLSATPRIQAEVQQRLDIVADPVAARQEQATRNLINAINQLTAAIQGQGNGAASPTGQVTRRDQNIWRNMSQEQRFFYQKQAKFMVENGLVG